MANRKRGTFLLPDELKTNQRLSTKKELAQNRGRLSCPSVRRDFKRLICFSGNTDCDKPRAVFFNNSVELNQDYNPNLNSSYFDQLYPSRFVIGEGSFGEVYRARAVYDNGQYAIKRLKPSMGREYMYAEIKNNEKLGYHPNCVQYFMAWEECGELFMLLEACEMSLSDYSTLNSDIPEELLWDVLYDMCQALNHLHVKKLLHLDVKPANIMMKNGHYKLADFGILIDLNLEPLNCKSTLSDGDGKYLAIEVLDKIYTPYCDIFGLGLSLLELAADLELPSNGPLWQQLRHEILPQCFYERVSLGFKVIIERMLKPEYEKRPSAETILKFSALRSIEKRDKKHQRVNFAAEYLTPDRSDSEIDNDNNNVIHTPSNTWSRTTTKCSIKLTASPKVLFQVDKRKRDLTFDDPLKSPNQTDSMNNSKDTDISILAVNLHDSFNFDNIMETDEMKVSDSDSDMTPKIVSTPIQKRRLLNMTV